MTTYTNLFIYFVTVIINTYFISKCQNTKMILNKPDLLKKEVEKEVSMLLPTLLKSTLEILRITLNQDKEAWFLKRLLQELMYQSLNKNLSD